MHPVGVITGCHVISLPQGLNFKLESYNVMWKITLMSFMEGGYNFLGGGAHLGFKPLLSFISLCTRVFMGLRNQGEQTIQV